MGQGSGRIVAGLDVHKRSTRIAAVQEDRLLGEVTVASDLQIVEAALRRLGVEVCCYEAGPTGYGLYRYLNERGLVCEVIAPGLVWRQPGDRVSRERKPANCSRESIVHLRRAWGWDPRHIPRTYVVVRVRARLQTTSAACKMSTFARSQKCRP